MKLPVTICVITFIILIDKIQASRINFDKKVKIKRGIYSGQQYETNYQLLPASVPGLTYGIASENQWHYPSVYNKFPSFTKAGTQQYVLTHGGATVQSQNINYPRYKYVQHNNLIPQHQIAIPGQQSVVPFQIPQYNQNFLPLQTIPQISISSNMPSASPTISTAFGHQFRPFFTPQNPIIPIAIPTNAIKPVTVSKTPLTITPVFSYNSQFFPIPLPTQPINTDTKGTSSFVPTMPTTFSIQPTEIQPTQEASPGTTLFSNSNPNQSWRPMTTTNPTQVSPDIPRPPISLLPPYDSPSPIYDLNQLSNSQIEDANQFNKGNLKFK